jgi:hypothetical protein
MSQAQINFMKQQGFADAGARTCDFQYPALMFQPRVIGVLVLAGVLLQSSPLFLTLSALLWSALVPRLNPFDRLYNSFGAVRRGSPVLTSAPAPRRFAQAMAAAFTLLIGVSLLAGWDRLAWVLEALLLAALWSSARSVWAPSCSTFSPETVKSPGERCLGAEGREVARRRCVSGRSCARGGCLLL